MSEKTSGLKKVYFDSSTIETIDKSVLNFLKELKLFASTNEGWREVPVVWGTSERAFQVKNNKEIRDQQGLLKLPIITVYRGSIVKDMSSKIQVYTNNNNLPENIYDIIVRKLDIGDTVGIKGKVFFTKTNELSINADEIQLLSKNLHPLPNMKEKDGELFFSFDHGKHASRSWSTV